VITTKIGVVTRSQNKKFKQNYFTLSSNGFILSVKSKKEANQSYLIQSFFEIFLKSKKTFLG